MGADDPWTTLYPQILKRIQAPKIAAREFDVTRYGAKTDGKTDCTAAFRVKIKKQGRFKARIDETAQHLGDVSGPLKVKIKH